MNDTISDQELVRMILARDRTALSLFYRRYTPKLAAFIRAKIANQLDAEEILQDTLFACLDAIRDFHGNASLKTYLFSIASHKVIDHYRKKKIKLVLFSQAPGLESLVSPLLTPEDELDVTMLKEKIHLVFTRILPRYKSLLVSKYLEDLSVGEIARKFSLTFKSAESQLFRARKAFVELFLSI